MGELRNRSVSGILWTTIESGFLQFSRFILVIILARLLSPADFGLIAMITVFITVGEVISNSGIKSAIIRKKDVSQIELSTAFYFNMAISLSIYLIIFFTSGLISDFYNQPQLELLIKYVALNIIFDAFGIVQTAIATQKINFKLLTIIQVISISIAGIVGIIMAYLNYGVWALVAQSLVNNFLKSLFLWIAQKWLPSLKISFKALKSMLSFGVNILLGNLIDKIFMQLSTLIIGKFYSATELGFYSQGKRISSLPSNSINDIVRKVSYPVFALIQDNDLKMKQGFKIALKSLVFLNFPIMIWLMTVSDIFIPVVLSEKWTPSIPYLQLLCIVGIMTPFNSLNVNIIIAKGFSNFALRLEFFKKLIMIFAIVITVKIGIIAIIVGEVISALLAYLINSYYPGKLVHYSFWEQLRDITPYLIISLAMAVILLILKSLLPLDNMFGLLFLAIAGIVIYFGSAYYFKLEALLIMKDSINKLIKKQ